MKGKDIDFLRIGLVVCGIGAGFVAGWIWGPTNPGSGQALRLITMFSLLFGIVMTAIISLGDPAKLFGTSWRSASEHRRQNRRSMLRYIVLLYMYFSVVGLAFASAVVSGPYHVVALLLDRAAIAVGAVALVWSLALPISIYRRNLEQLDNEIVRRWEQDTTEREVS